MLLRTRRFLPLFITQFAGALNDNLLKNALVISVIYRSATVFGLPAEQIVALAGGIFILPFFLFSALAGQLSDRFDKKSIILWVKVSEIGIMILAGVAFWTSNDEILLIALFSMGVHSSFFGPVKYSILPQHLSSSELMSGNGWIEAGTFLAILLGTLLGGILIALPNGPVCVSWALAVTAIIGLIAAWEIPKAPAADPNLSIHWNPFAPTWGVLRRVMKDPFMLRVISAISWFWFFGAVVLSVIPLIGKHHFHAKESVVTLFLAVFSVGIGVGSMGCGKLSHHRARTRISFWGLVGLSVFSFSLAGTLPPAVVSSGLDLLSLRTFLGLGYSWAVLASLVGIAISGGLFIVPLYTLMQEHSDPLARSRVIAANNIVNALFMVAAAAMLAILLTRNYSVGQIFVLLAVLNLLVIPLIARLRER